MSAAWSDLRIRIVSTAVLAPLGLLAIWFGGPLYAGMLALVTAGLIHEWGGLLVPAGARFAWPGLLFAAVLLPGLVLIAGLGATSLAALGLTAGLLFMRLRRHEPSVGVLYIGLGYLALLWLRQGPTGRANMQFLALVVWANDIGAYLVGRWVGGPRLWPAISPGKTWSGALGGLLAAHVAGIAVAAYVAPQHGEFWQAGLAAVGLAAVAQGGDLLESAIKRYFGKKDSGALIPGHGGLLDRLDGLLAAAPAAAGLLLAVHQGLGGLLWR